MKRKRYVKRKNNGAKVVLSLLIGLLVIAIGVGGLLLWQNRQTLDGSSKTSKSYVTDSGVAATRTTEKQRYFEIDVRQPDYETANPPAELKAFYAAEQNSFEDALALMLKNKTLNKKDPASLSIDFDAAVFEGYTTYTVRSRAYTDSASEPAVTTRRFIADGSGALLTSAALFKDGSSYVSLLNAKVAAALGDAELAAQLTAAQDPYNEKLTLGASGLIVDLGQAGTDTERQVTLDYTSLYNSLAIKLPDSFKPAEPTPIDPSAEKVIALTFDDGPHGNWTPKLLDLLKKYNARATFFVVGYNVDYHPDIIKRMVNEGQQVAIHSTDHISLLKTGRTDADLLKDIDGMAEKINGICGVSPYIMRPVGGSVNARVAEVLARPCIIWDVDPQDWKYRDADHVYEQVMKYAKSGDIVLSHDIYESTYEAYCRIIPELAEQGYRFVTVSELLGIENLENTDAYAGKIVYYRALSRELRNAGAFDTAQAG